MGSAYTDARDELTEACLDNHGKPYGNNAMIEVYASDVSAVLNPPETIVAAAIQIAVPDSLREKMWKGERVYPDFLTISAPPPARHGTLLHPTYEINGVRPIGANGQGFLTSTGRFVGREEALQIALASGQPMIDHPARNPRYLFSEDLW